MGYCCSNALFQTGDLSGSTTEWSCRIPKSVNFSLLLYKKGFLGRSKYFRCSVHHTK
jgi:hypothetical protein